MALKVTNKIVDSLSGFPIVGEALGGAPPPHRTIFFSKPPPPTKTDASPHLKMKPLHLKNKPPIET